MSQSVLGPPYIPEKGIARPPPQRLKLWSLGVCLGCNHGRPDAETMSGVIVGRNARPYHSLTYIGYKMEFVNGVPSGKQKMGRQYSPQGYERQKSPPRDKARPRLHQETQ